MHFLLEALVYKTAVVTTYGVVSPLIVSSEYNSNVFVLATIAKIKVLTNVFLFWLFFKIDFPYFAGVSIIWMVIGYWYIPNPYAKDQKKSSRNQNSDPMMEVQWILVSPLNCKNNVQDAMTRTHFFYSTLIKPTASQQLPGAVNRVVLGGGWAHLHICKSSPTLNHLPASAGRRLGSFTYIQMNTTASHPRTTQPPPRTTQSPPSAWEVGLIRVYPGEKRDFNRFLY